jgi:hypothetical protein
LSLMKKTPLCKNCFLSRFERLFPSDTKISESQINQCQKCSDWLINYNNNTGWILKLSDYPSVSCTSFEESAPSPPQGREITNQTLLAPCKISFSFLPQAYKYTKFIFLRRDGWTKAMTKVYLWTCCMSGNVSKNFFIKANEVKKNNAPKTIISLPVLWLQHEELGIKMKQFSDAPMHMLFLGVTKHLMAHVDHLFGIQNSSFRTFCGIISKHVEFSKDISLKWCPIAGFAEAESISTTGWQSAQYVAFSRLSLV